MKEKANILWFKEISNDDVAFVGGKNASLGEMFSELSERGIRIPNGFAITAHAYREFVKESGIDDFIRKELADLDTHNIRQLQKKGRRVRRAFLTKRLSKPLIKEIVDAYKKLSDNYGKRPVDVAVRSSATAEDLPGASFAGQQETYLNIRGRKAVIHAVRAAMASLFTDRAISYRVDKGFDHFDVALSVGVQKMVRSDKASAGVMFTLDTESGFRDIVQISSSWGLGEMVVQGKVTPDEFIVFKPTLKEGFDALIKKDLGEKALKMVYGNSISRPVKVLRVPEKEQNIFSINDKEILQLSKWGMEIEEHYSKRAGKDRPMDIEWAKDGEDGKLYIVQARPETVQSEKNQSEIIEYKLESKEKPIVIGIAVGRKISKGKARVILSTSRLHEFQEGEILITEITDPDWEPIMKKAKAIITEKGGRTSHAAIVSRELGIPAVIGAPGATRKIKTGQMVTVDTSSGVDGNVYAGELKWKETKHNLGQIPDVKTHICLNIGTPDGAFVYSFLPHSGVGLAREEFIIASKIGIHPMALINYEKLKDKKLKKEIEKRTKEHENKSDFFIYELAEGVAQIGAAFYPHPVIVRFSDFKTNEYRALLGGELYEPEEENPMLGWRGASRYTHSDFIPAFKLEVAAIKRVREVFGLKNVQTMIPFCRTPDEGRKVLKVMEEAGLKKGKDGLEVMVMCEIPTNVIRANEFLDVFDGFSIGSNDLTQLTLGMDRDSALVAPISNENDVAVKKLVARAIRICKERNKYIGFCGQAPSDYPEFTRFLVERGIEAISLNPDSLVPMIFEVAKAEKKVKK